MGRSKFPGKPSKSVMKERIRVLYKDENGKCEKETAWDTNKNKAGEGSSPNDGSLLNSSINFKEQTNLNAELSKTTNADSINKPRNPTSYTRDRSIKTNAVEIGQSRNWKHNSDDLLKQEEEKNVPSAGLCVAVLNPNISNSGSTKYSLTELDKLIKKKTVTFKNVLETSDDTSIIKKIHNPLNKRPLVSIMKKECHTSQGYMTRGDGIVRPSRLTEILKNNENIDKTKSLSFRSVQSSSNKSDSTESEKLEVGQVSHRPSSIREVSPKMNCLDKERNGSEFEISNQNESVDKAGYQSNEDNCSQLLYKWELYKLYPKSDHFDFRVHLELEALEEPVFSAGDRNY